MAFRYTGQRHDPETGLYYFRARYYDPLTGRFISPDPIGYGDGLNMYAYVGNDPVNFIDVTGLYTQLSNGRDENGEYQHTVGIGGAMCGFVCSMRGGPLDLYDASGSHIGVYNHSGMNLTLSLGAAALTVQSSVPLAAEGAYISAAAAVTRIASSNFVQRQINRRVVRQIIKGSVDDFISANQERLNKKLGRKISLGEIPFPRNAQGRPMAIAVIRETLLNPSKIANSFTTKAGHTTRDIFSSKTGFTVRIRPNGEFDTLIDQITDRF